MEQTKQLEALSEALANDSDMFARLVEHRGGCRCCISPPCFACCEPLTEHEAECLGWLEAAAPRTDYFQQQLSEEADKAWSDLQKVSTALPPIAGLSFLPDVAKHSHQVNPGGVVRFGSADLL
jgi:hypothetical protein